MLIGCFAKEVENLTCQILLEFTHIWWTGYISLVKIITCASTEENSSDFKMELLCSVLKKLNLCMFYFSDFFIRRLLGKSWGNPMTCRCELTLSYTILALITKCS